MNSTDSLKTVLITGGGSGLGLQVARIFSEARYRVLLLGRSLEKINSAVTSLQFWGAEIYGYQTDVSDKNAIADLFKKWDQEQIFVDTLINNAGIITPIAPLDRSDPIEWLGTLKTNLYGCYLCAREALHRMLPKAQGVIINISSGAAHFSLEGWSPYCVSKAGLKMLTACLHQEYVASGIRVMGYRPGSIDTPMQEIIRLSKINPISQIKRSELSSPVLSAQGVFYLANYTEDDYLGEEVDFRDSEFCSRAGIVKQ